MKKEPRPKGLAPTRPMNDRGQGRKPLNSSGELMKPRAIRMTDAEWEAAKLVGTQAIREFVTKQAKKMKAICGALLTEDQK
jgi:hypothetical protein